MTKKELIEILNNSFSKDDDEVVIEIYQPGSIGSTPSVSVKSVSTGFDWNKGKIIVTPEVEIKKADFDYEEKIKVLVKEIGKLKLSNGISESVATAINKSDRKKLEEDAQKLKEFREFKLAIQFGLPICLQNGLRTQRFLRIRFTTWVINRQWNRIL